MRQQYQEHFLERETGNQRKDEGDRNKDTEVGIAGNRGHGVGLDLSLNFVPPAARA